MKYKTLFRLTVKAIGLWLLTQAVLHACTATAHNVIALAITGPGPLGAVQWWSPLLTSAPYIAIGAYLFLGGRWIVDLAIPSNRPYCHECGYELSRTIGNTCPECGTAFRPPDPARSPGA